MSPVFDPAISTESALTDYSATSDHVPGARPAGGRGRAGPGGPQGATAPRRAGASADRERPGRAGEPAGHRPVGGPARGGGRRGPEVRHRTAEGTRTRPPATHAGTSAGDVRPRLR